MRLKDKVAIVTGGGSGFGEGICKRFAQEGAKVVVNDINVEGGERVAKEISSSGGQATFVKADVAKDADWAALVQARRSMPIGELNIVVNNAGTTHRNQPHAQRHRRAVRSRLRGEREEPVLEREALRAGISQAGQGRRVRQLSLPRRACVRDQA